MRLLLVEDHAELAEWVARSLRHAGFVLDVLNRGDHADQALRTERYDLVILGQLVPPYHGMGLVDYPEFYSYSPTLHEQLVVVGGAAFCGLFFLLGERYFRGHLVDSH